MTMSRLHLSAAVAAIVLAGPLAGSAWSADLTADQIIAKLRPDSASLSGPTRGIRAMVPGTTVAGAPSVRRVSMSQHVGSQQGGQASSNSADINIQFNSGSAELSPSSRSQLDQLGRALTSQALAADKIRIEGHTDTVGVAADNKTLSERRATAVADYLKAKFGMQPGRLEAAGLGEDGLLVKTPDQTPDIRNRRVHIVDLSA